MTTNVSKSMHESTWTALAIPGLEVAAIVDVDG